MGTTSAYLNVASALYLFLVIKLSWSDTRLKKIKPWLFICPVIVGMSFAFAGIPFYDNMILWCNNTAAWWPEIPMTCAIAIATVLMTTICWHVYQEEKVSLTWRLGRNSGSRSMFEMVFWQSFWYLMAFYMTWPPYLALQYLWADGKAFSNYGFVLYAGTVVPMQGFWNLIVYMRRKNGSSPGQSRIGSFRAAARSSITKSISFRKRSSGNVVDMAADTCMAFEEDPIAVVAQAQGDDKAMETGKTVSFLLADKASETGADTNASTFEAKCDDKVAEENMSTALCLVSPGAQVGTSANALSLMAAEDGADTYNRPTVDVNDNTITDVNEAAPSLVSAMDSTSIDSEAAADDVDIVS